VYQTTSAWNNIYAVGLSTNTQYIFDIIARNGDGIDIISPSSGTYTLAAIACAPILSAIGTTSMSIEISPDTNPADVIYAIRITSGGYNNEYIQTGGTIAPVAVYQTASSWGTQYITGLSTDTQYVFDVVARNNDGIDSEYSTAIGTYTLADIPGVPNLYVLGSSSISIELITASNPSNTKYAIRINGNGFEDEYVQAGGTVAATAVYQTESIWGNKYVIGLSANMQYTFDVQAKNGDNVETEYSSSSQRYTSADTPGAPDLANIGLTSMTINIVPNGNSTTTVYAIRISTDMEEGSWKWLQIDGRIGDTAVYQTDMEWAHNM